MTAVFYDIYLFSISTLFKILELATSSYVGSVLKKICQKFATVHKGLTLFAYGETGLNTIYSSPTMDIMADS